MKYISLFLLCACAFAATLRAEPTKFTTVAHCGDDCDCPCNDKDDENKNESN